MILTEQDIIAAWGTPEQFYKELREFLDKHDAAQLKTFDVNGNLVSATYLFWPYSVATEKQELIEAIKQEADHER